MLPPVTVGASSTIHWDAAKYPGFRHPREAVNGLFFYFLLATRKRQGQSGIMETRHQMFARNVLNEARLLLVHRGCILNACVHAQQASAARNNVWVRPAVLPMT